MGEAEAIAAAPASPRKPSGMFSYLLLIVFLVFIVYPLSLGPVARFYTHHPTAPGSIQVRQLYEPILIVCRNNQLAAHWVDAYLRLWQSR